MRGAFLVQEKQEIQVGSLFHKDAHNSGQSNLM